MSAVPTPKPAAPEMSYRVERFDPKEWTTRADRRRHGTTGEIQWRLMFGREWCQTYYTRREAVAAMKELQEEAAGGAR